MRKVKKFLILIFSIISILIGIIYVTSPLWVRYAIFYVLNKNFGESFKVEDVRYVFPDKIQIAKLELGNFASFSNVSLSIGDAIKLSPITLELVKPKIIIIHDEKGEWKFPEIPGIGKSGTSSQNISIELKGKIKDGIFVIRDLKLKKDIEINKVNGDLSYKNQVINYNVATILDDGLNIKAYGYYNFSKLSGDLTFEFKNTNATIWAPIFLPDMFKVEKGTFSGWFNTKGDKDKWSYSGEVDAKDIKGSISGVPGIIENVYTKVKINNENISIVLGNGVWFESLVNFSGKVAPNPDIQISFKNLNGEKIDKEFLNSALKLKGRGEGNLNIKNSWDKPWISGVVYIKDGTIYDIKFDNISLNLDAKIPGFLVSFTGDLEIGKASGNMNYDLEKNAGKFYLSGENVRLDKISKLFNLPDIEGNGSLEVKGNKEAGKGWRVFVNGVIENGKMGDYSAEKIIFSLENEEGSLNFDLLKNSGFFLKS
jgi:hypothetical protein